MQIQVNEFENAYKIVLKELRKRGYRWTHLYPINFNRYIIVEGVEGQINLMIMFKREVFFNLGRQFSKYGKYGVGDTINVDDLKTAVRNNVSRLYTIFPNGYIYYISIGDFINYSHKWINKEGKEVRSISIHHYKRLE